MKCIYCGQKLALLRKLTDSEFCSSAHRRQYHQDQEKLALARLIDAQSRFSTAVGLKHDAAKAAAAADGRKTPPAVNEEEVKGFLPEAPVYAGERPILMRISSDALPVSPVAQLPAACPTLDPAGVKHGRMVALSASASNYEGWRNNATLRIRAPFYQPVQPRLPGPRLKEMPMCAALRLAAPPPKPPVTTSRMVGPLDASTHLRPLPPLIFWPALQTPALPSETRMAGVEGVRGKAYSGYLVPRPDPGLADFPVVVMHPRGKGVVATECLELATGHAREAREMLLLLLGDPDAELAPSLPPCCPTPVAALPPHRSAPMTLPAEQAARPEFAFEPCSPAPIRASLPVSDGMLPVEQPESVAATLLLRNEPDVAAPSMVATILPVAIALRVVCDFRPAEGRILSLAGPTGQGRDVAVVPLVSTPAPLPAPAYGSVRDALYGADWTVEWPRTSARPLLDVHEPALSTGWAALPDPLPCDAKTRWRGRIGESIAVKGEIVVSHLAPANPSGLLELPPAPATALDMAPVLDEASFPPPMPGWLVCGRPDDPESELELGYATPELVALPLFGHANVSGPASAKNLYPLPTTEACGHLGAKFVKRDVQPVSPEPAAMKPPSGLRAIADGETAVPRLTTELFERPIREVLAAKKGWKMPPPWQRITADARWLALCVPILVGFGLYLASPTRDGEDPDVAATRQGAPVAAAVPAGAVGRQWEDFRQAILKRAAIELSDDFRNGLADWEGVPGWSGNWSYDPAGFVRTGPLAVFRPSMEMSDYRIEFLGQIERKGLGWAFRVADLKNYYAMKLAVVKPGPLPQMAVEHFSVVDGVEGRHVSTPLPMAVRNDTLYRIRVDVRGSTFTTYVQGQMVDHWTDERLKSGGVGFFSAKGEQARLRWVEVQHQYDALGRLCAFIAPYGLPTREGKQ